MITFFTGKNNILKYEKFINNLEASQLECTCGCKGSCIKHGKYKRKLKRNDKTTIIYIQRIYCKECKATNALLPKGIVPYQTLCLDDMLETIETYEANPDFSYDNEAKRIIKRYNTWKTKLASIKLTIKDGIEKIILFCAREFKACFLQTKRKKYRRQGKIYEVIFKAA
jgi:hypothetical protein